MIRYTHIKSDGTQTVVTPPNGKKFTLDELQAFVGGYIQLVEFPHRCEMWINEEGKMIDLPYNRIASKKWFESYGATDTIVGDVLYVEKGLKEL